MEHFWKTADAMHFSCDEKRQVYLQDDGFMLRKPWDDSRIPPEKRLRATTDAKYLEVGPTGKSDNVDALFARFGFAAEDCCFWGDEFIGVTDSIFGSDAGMLTPTTQNSDFYDVSDLEGVRPGQVKQLGGGIQTFLDFLREQ